MALSDVDEKYIREYLKRSVENAIYIESRSSIIAAELVKLHSEILDEIKAYYPDAKSSQIRKISDRISEMLLAHNVENTYPTVEKFVSDFTSGEVLYAQDSIALYATTEINTVNDVRPYKRAIKKTYQGHTFNYWYDGVAKEAGKKVENILRSGYTTGETTEEVVKKIASALNAEKNDVRTLTRSFLQHSSREARDSVYDVNGDMIEGYYWVATLDGRTTVDICGIRDGKFYDKNRNPVGHSNPWEDGPGRIHFNCRSDSVAKIFGQGNIFDEFRRASVEPGKNYKSGDLKTRTGRVRKPTKYNRDSGKLRVKQQPIGIDYEEFIRKQKLSYIEDIIGSDYAKEFKAGNLSLLQVINMKASANNTF